MKSKNGFSLKLLLSLFFFLSRLVFLNTSPIFFDSPEYINRFSQQSLYKALMLGHWPYHFGYILLYWPFARVSYLIFKNPAIGVLLIQAAVSYLGVVWFYKIVKILKNQKIALKAAIIVSILPLYWIANSTLMEETAYLSFFIGSIYFFVSYLKKREEIKIILSSIFFAFSYFTNLVVLLWAPLYLVLGYKKVKSWRFLYFLLFTLLAVLCEGYLISSFSHSELFPTIFKTYGSKNNEFAKLNFSLYSLGVFSRNFFIPLFRSNTTIVVVLSFLSLIKLLKKDKRSFFIGFFWLVPSLLVNQWSDSLFYGRQALISSFGLAYLASLLLKKDKFFFIITCAIFITSFYALLLLKQPIPYLEESNMVKGLPSNALLLESHYARPQIEPVVRGKVVFINEPGSLNPKEALEKYFGKTPIYVTGQALSEPYGLFSGPYLHVIGLSYKKNFDLEKLLNNYELKEYRVEDEKSNIVLYRIVARKISQYPQIKKLNFSEKRMDYFDPFTQAGFLIHFLLFR